MKIPRHIKYYARSTGATTVRYRGKIPTSRGNQLARPTLFFTLAE